MDPAKTTISPLKGRWKIIWMEGWGQDYVDAEVPGHITFDDQGRGEFQFGYVCGGFYWTEKDSHFDSKWNGNDEMDEAFGEIYGEIEDNELRGTIEFFNGDESDFRAVRENEKRRSG
jgi:hypothetical protein